METLKGWSNQKWQFCHHSKPVWLTSVEHKTRYFEECWLPHSWLPLNVQKIQLKSVKTETVWWPTFFKITSLMFCRRTRLIQAWNDMRVSKRGENFHFLGGPFNRRLFFCEGIWLLSVFIETLILALNSLPFVETFSEMWFIVPHVLWRYLTILSSLICHHCIFIKQTYHKFSSS